MDEEIYLDFTYEKKEYIKALRYLYKTSFMEKKAGVVFFFLVLVISLIFYEEKITIVSLIPAFLLLFILICLVLAYFYLPNKLFLRGTHNKSYKLTFIEEAVFLGSYQGIDKVNGTRINWNEYSYILENKEFFYLFYKSGVYIIIPKRVFRDQNQISTFINLCERKIDSIRERH